MMQTQYLEESATTACGLTLCASEDLVDWINARKQSSEAAFSILMERHHSWIFKRSLYRLSNEHDAEDATQDIILRVKNNLHQFKGNSLFKTWLTTIIDNYCFTFARRRSRYTNCDHLEQLIELQQQEEVSDPYSALAEHQQIHLALATLPENAKQVLNLRFFGDYSLEEIARLLGLTLSAAKARLYRAIEQLKNIYFELNSVKQIHAIA